MLAIAGAGAAEADGAVIFTVSLSSAGAEPVTVRYATENGTATAGSDYEAASGTLTFPAGSSAGRTITITVYDDVTAEPEETFTVRLSEPRGAALAAAAAMGTISDDDAHGIGVEPTETTSDRPSPVLSALQVTGGGPMYPPFDAGIRHYALTCADSTTLQVTAQASPSDTTLTLLRANEDDHQRSTGSLDVEVTVNSDHDIAIHLSVAGATEAATYVVHCIPPAFPDIKILKRTKQASDGLLLVAPRYGSYGSHTSFSIVLDYNGVPRFHRISTGLFDNNFRRHGHAGASYSVTRKVEDSGNSEVDLLNGDFAVTSIVRTVSPLTNTDFHDFLVTGSGTRLFISYQPAARDFRPYGRSATEEVRDSVIQEVGPGGESVFVWNSWDHREVMNIGNDCTVAEYPGEYAHLNSLQWIGGDIIASFRGCAQVLRLDWSGTDKGTVKWKLGGTAPPENSGVEHLEIVGDDEAGNEFCGQHQATLTGDSIVLFDNGNHCLGSRKAGSPFTRVVEYDISSGTQAEFVREYRLPEKNGYADIRGGVTVLGNNERWLIAWGSRKGGTVPVAETIAITEVDPATGAALFHMHMSKADQVASTYRVYGERESAVPIPLNLP